MTDYIHLDVMDGNFVKNTCHLDHLTFLKKPLDVHLMVEDVLSYIDIYAKLKPKYITFHLEISQNIEEVICKIKDTGAKVGISVKPETKIEALLPYLEEIDLVLVMSVEPGLGGQNFMEEAISKIQTLKNLRENHPYHYLIEVDGGINDQTCQFCRQADLLVVGSFITNTSDFDEAIKKIK